MKLVNVHAMRHNFTDDERHKVDSSVAMLELTVHGGGERFHRDIILLDPQSNDVVRLASELISCPRLRDTRSNVNDDSCVQFGQLFDSETPYVPIYDHPVNRPNAAVPVYDRPANRQNAAVPGPSRTVTGVSPITGRSRKRLVMDSDSGSETEKEPYVIKKVYLSADLGDLELPSSEQQFEDSLDMLDEYNGVRGLPERCLEQTATGQLLS